MKTLINDAKHKLKNPSAVRVGLCPNDYLKNLSLGQDISVGYKSKTGEFVYQGKSSAGGECFEEGDIIGLCYSFSPPDRYQNQDLLWEGSYFVITKNGKPIARWDQIHQSFYSPAVSLYNHAKVELRYKREQMDFLPESYTPYYDMLKEEVTY